MSTDVGLPLLVGLLAALAILTAWMALAPSRRVKAVDERLDQYLDRGDIFEAAEFDKPFARRALAPMLRRTLRAAGSLLPSRNLKRYEETLERAGRPGGLTALDFVGLRIMTALAVGAATWFYMSRGEESSRIIAAYAVIAGLVGFILPPIWLRRKANHRRDEIQRALPDALDMLTIGVEAGLAFESAMLRVGEQWDNALSHEFRRVVAEMRMGTPRADSLRRMAERSGVADLTTFVAILIQSNQLGVSIANVIHTQADQMRLKRRQRAEEQSRKASVKVTIVVAIFILPSLFIVILGPAIPKIMDALSSAGGG